MTARETLRQNLRYLREMNRMTQLEVAKKAGMKRSNYGAVEEDRSTLSPDYLVTFSKLYSVSVDNLLTKKLEKHGEEMLQVQNT